MRGAGVDIVEVARIAAADRRASGRLVARVCTAAEQAWLADADRDLRLAACFALKEAWIKAVAGRPTGFTWTTHGVQPATREPATAQLLRDVGATNVAACSIGGVPAAWALRDDDVIALVGTPARCALAVVEARDADPQALTTREREYCAGQVARIAGRLAAKAAVRSLTDRGAVEIRPGVHPPDAPHPCRGEGHPPEVWVDEQRSDVRVSISHHTQRAIAIAWRHEVQGFAP